MPAKQNTNPHNNNGQVEPVWANDKVVYATALSSTMAPSSCTGVAPLSSYSTSIKGAKGGPSGTGSIASPHITHLPTSFIWTSLGRIPNSSTLLDCQILPKPEVLLLLRPSSAVALVVTSSSGSLKTQYPPLVEVVSRLPAWNPEYGGRSQSL